MANPVGDSAALDVENGNGELAVPAAPPIVLEHARLGNLDQFREALESGNHPLDFRAGRDVCSNRTPLHLAAMEGHDEIVEFILSRSEDNNTATDVVNAKDCFGYSPLHLAVRYSRGSFVQLLTASSRVLPDRFLAATREPDELGMFCGGCTPLHLAAVGVQLAIVKTLLRQPRQREFAYDPVNICAVCWAGETPLDVARRCDFSYLVDFLEGSDLNWLQLERARTAMSANAILVGAALVAAAAFGACLQPPGGIPDPGAPSPSPTGAPSPSPSPPSASARKSDESV